MGKADVNPYEDLTFTYTLNGQPGTYSGNLIIVPEPSTLIMVLSMGTLGLLMLLRRRKR